MEIQKEEIKELFEQKGYYISDYLLSKACLGLYYISEGQSVGQEVFSMCLDGPSGAGKTFFVETYCKIASSILEKPVKFINFQLDAETGKSDLYEDIDIVATFEGDTSKIRIPGKIIEAFKAVNDGNYVILKMDEYDKARDVTDTFFNNCLQEGLINTIQHGNIEIKPENRGMLQVFLCKNDMRAELSEPMMRRNRIARLDYMPPERLFLVLNKFVEKQKCSNGLLNLVILIYEQLYNERDIYKKLPSCSECEQAIMDAHVLMGIGQFTQNDIYTNIIEDMLKMPDDMKTFESRISASKSENGKKLANLIKDMKNGDSNQTPPSINSLIAKNIFKDQIQELKTKTDQMQKLIDEYTVKFYEMEEKRRAIIGDEIQKIILQGGKLVPTNIPNAARLFEDESAYIKRGFNIFELANGDWTNVGSAYFLHLSQHLLVDKMIEYAPNLGIKIFENGVLLKEDGELRLIVITELDKQGGVYYRFMSSHSVLPSTYIENISNFLNLAKQVYDKQPKTAKMVTDRAVGILIGRYEVSTLVYNDTKINFDTVQDNVYLVEFAGKVTDDKLENFNKEAVCSNINLPLQISEQIMNGKAKVLKNE